MRQLPLAVRLRDRASFDQFHPAAAPEALAHLQRLASGEPGMIWLHGPAGVGKTHLLQALCNAVPTERRTALLPVRELMAASEPLDASVLDGWQSLDVCAIDDLDLLVGRQAMERALFSLYREIEERRAALVVSAERAPADLPWVLRDIASRFGAAHVYRLRELDEGEQGQALVQRAASRGLDLPEETVRYLQRRMPRDLRQLCALLDTLDDASLVEQRRITVPFIREVLGDAD